MRRLISPFVALAVLGVVLAYPLAAPAADPTPAAAVSAASADVRSASPTLERIRRTGTVTLAYRDGARPFSFRERGQVRGYAADICLRVVAGIQKELGLPELKVTWTAVDAAARIDVVAAGKADIACGNTTVTLQRMKTVDFSLPIFVDGGTVLVRSDARLLQLAELRGRKLAVIPNTTTESALRRALDVAGAAATLVPIDDAARGMALLIKGEVDGLAGDRLVLAALRSAASNPADFSFLQGDFSVEPYALVLPRNDADFRLVVNRALVGLYRGGEIDSIFQRWLGGIGEPSPLLHAMIYLNMLPE